MWPDSRETVDHVVTTQGMFLGFVGRSVGDIPTVADDPLGAFTAARTAVQRDLEDPARAGAEFEGGMGKMTFESGVDRFLNFDGDVVVHTWDLARATGLDDRIDPADLERIRVAAESFGDAMRGPNAFGPEVEPPAGADDQQRVLAFLGRQP